MSPGKTLLKHSSIYALGNLSRQVVGFLMLPIYTQYLTPSDYGVVGLLILMVSLTEIIFGGHMVHAASKYFYDAVDEKSQCQVMSTALILTSLISTFAVMLTLAVRDPLSILLFGEATYSTIVAIFGVQILMHALENYALVYIRIQQRPWLFITASLCKMILQLALNIYFVVIMEKGVMGVALSGVLSSLMFCSVMTVYLIRNIGLGFASSVAGKLFKFSWPLWVGGLAGLYIGSSNRYFVRIFSSLGDVGLLELASKFGSIIPLLIWVPFAQYWQVERFRIFKQENAREVYRQVFKFICSLLAIAGVGIVVFGEVAVRLMAEDAFYPSSRAIPFLVISGILSCATIFCNFSFLVMEKTGWMSRNSYLTAGIITVFNLALIPYFGFVGAAAASAISAGIQFLIVHHAGKQVYDMGIRIRHLYVNVLVVVIVAVAVPLLRHPHVLGDIFVKLAVCLVAMGILGLLFLREFFDESAQSMGWVERVMTLLKGVR